MYCTKQFPFTCFNFSSFVSAACKSQKPESIQNVTHVHDMEWLLTASELQFCYNHSHFSFFSSWYRIMPPGSFPISRKNSTFTLKTTEWRACNTLAALESGAILLNGKVHKILKLSTGWTNTASLLHNHLPSILSFSFLQMFQNSRANRGS